MTAVRMPQEKPLQGIPKKICAAKIFWEEEQQVYISKRRIAARKNYLVATSAAIRGFFAREKTYAHAVARVILPFSNIFVKRF